MSQLGGLKNNGGSKKNHAKTSTQNKKIAATSFPGKGVIDGFAHGYFG